MICDVNKSVAIAGVMGGENSEVTSSPKICLLRSAYFNPSSIRKTSKNLGLSTDASIDLKGGQITRLLNGQQDAAQLIQMTSGEKSL